MPTHNTDKTTPIYALRSFTANGESNFFLLLYLKFLEIFDMSVPWKLEISVAAYPLIVSNVILYTIIKQGTRYTIIKHGTR